MNLIKMPETYKGNKWILTLVDHTTGWPVAVSIPTATSQRVVDTWWDHMVLYYKFPHEIISDHDQNFLTLIMTAFL